MIIITFPALFVQNWCLLKELYSNSFIQLLNYNYRKLFLTSNIYENVLYILCLTFIYLIPFFSKIFQKIFNNDKFLTSIHRFKRLLRKKVWFSRVVFLYLSLCAKINVKLWLRSRKFQFICV